MSLDQSTPSSLYAFYHSKLPHRSLWGGLAQPALPRGGSQVLPGGGSQPLPRVGSQALPHKQGPTVAFSTAAAGSSELHAAMT